MLELFRRFFPYVLIVGLVVGVLWLAYSLGIDAATAEWQAKWNKQAAELSEAKTKAVTLAREEEQRRQSAIEQVRQDAEQQIARAETDAAAASAVAAGLHEQARRVAERASQCTSNPSAAQGGKAKTQPAVVLADVLSRADERAGELAAAYDRAHASGLACERAYDALRASVEGSNAAGPSGRG